MEGKKDKDEGGAEKRLREKDQVGLRGGRKKTVSPGALAGLIKNPRPESVPAPLYVPLVPPHDSGFGLKYKDSRGSYTAAPADRYYLGI